MKRVLIIILLLFPLSGLGQEPTGPCIYPIKKGEIAPYEGILYNYKADGIIQSELEYANVSCETKESFRSRRDSERCSLEKTQQKIYAEAQSNILKISLDNCTQERQRLVDLLGKQRAPIVIDNGHPKLWLALGITIGVVVGGGSIYLYEKFK